MASYTPNFNLKKPAGTENINVSDINGNMDTIDSVLKTLTDKNGKIATSLNEFISIAQEEGNQKLIRFDATVGGSIIGKSRSGLATIFRVSEYIIYTAFDSYGLVYGGYINTTNNDVVYQSFSPSLETKTVKLSEIGITSVTSQDAGWYYATSVVIPSNVVPSGRTIIDVQTAGYYYGDMVYDYYASENKIICRSMTSKSILNSNASVKIIYV